MKQLIKAAWKCHSVDQDILSCSTETLNADQIEEVLQKLSLAHALKGPIQNLTSKGCL
jgi:hypothetical protein